MAAIRLYYSAVDTDAKSTPAPGGPLANSPTDIPLLPLSRWRRAQIPLIAWAVYWIIRLIGPTLRLEMVGVGNAIQIRSAGEPGIGAIWHRCIFTAAKKCAMIVAGCFRPFSNPPVIRWLSLKVVPLRIEGMPALGCGAQNENVHDGRNPRSRIRPARDITKSKAR